MAVSRLVTRTIIVASGTATTMSLEPELWAAMDVIADESGQSFGDITDVAHALHPAGPRTSAVRVYVLEWFRAKAKGQT